MRRHELSDDEWRVIAPLLPQNSRGVARVDDDQRHPLELPRRLVLARRARALRPTHEFLQPLHVLAGVGRWDRLLDAVSRAYDGDIAMIDSSCVRVNQHGAASQMGALPILAWDAHAAA